MQISFWKPFFAVIIYPDQNNKRIVLALQSGLKSELTWALNTLTLLSFKEKDEVRRDATTLAKVPGLLDAILQVVRVIFNFLTLFKSFIATAFSTDHLYSPSLSVGPLWGILLFKEPKLLHIKISNFLTVPFSLKF